MKRIFETDYVVYDKLEDEILLLASGNIAIYGDKAEAEANCCGNECAVKCTDLPLHWQVDVLKQINKDGDEYVSINKLELASELAHHKLVNEWQESIQIYEDENAGITNYTEQAQDIFNEYYDQYIDLIESCKH